MRGEGLAARMCREASAAQRSGGEGAAQEAPRPAPPPHHRLSFERLAACGSPLPAWRGEVEPANRRHPTPSDANGCKSASADRTKMKTARGQDLSRGTVR